MLGDMQEYLKFYINGEWVDPVAPSTLDVINPTTEEPFAKISSTRVGLSGGTAMLSTEPTRIPR